MKKQIETASGQLTKLSLDGKILRLMRPGKSSPVPAAPAEAGELEAQNDGPEYSLKTRAAAVVALGAATVALAWTGVKGAELLNGDTPPVQDGAQISRLGYAPAGELDDSSPTLEATQKTMTHKYYADGHETGLLKPDKNARRFYRSTFSNAQVGKSKHIPHLTELAHMQDEEIFKPEYENYLYTYPVSILNNTRHPIDLMYMNYAIRAAKFSLGKLSQDSDGFVINGHTKVHVEPRAVPHTFVMTHKLPPKLHKSLPYSDGVTKWFSDHTSSFIKDSGNEHKPFVPWIVGTEICQALVNVYDAQVVPGHEEQQKDAQAYVATFNEGASEDLDLAMQEEECNSMGRELEAAYYGGEAAIDKLPSERELVGKSQTPWLDYNEFKTQAGAFIRIARNIKNGGGLSTLILTRGDNSPTARFYRQQENSAAG
jgi:hypothetical protein